MEVNALNSLIYQKNNVTHISFNNIRDINIYDYSNIIVILDEVMFDNIAKTGDEFESKFHDDNELLKKQPHLFVENFNKFFK